MSDGYVGLLPDSTGKKADTSEITRDSGTVVERQRTNVADPVLAAAIQTVALTGEALVNEPSARELLAEILLELRVHSYLLRAGLNVSDTVDNLRESYRR